MSVQRDSGAPTKEYDDYLDCSDSGILSGPISCLQSSEDCQPEPLVSTKVVPQSDPAPLDSGLDLTLSEDLSNIDLSDKGTLLPECTVIERPLINISDDTTDVPPLPLLFQQDDDGDTQLHIIAVLGCHKSMSTLIRVCPDKTWLDLPNDYGHTALHLAVLSQHYIITRMLVIAGASIGVRDVAGDNPLHLAAFAGNVDCIKALLDPVLEQPRKSLSSVMNNKNYNGQASVHLAAVAGHVDALHALTFYGADINAREGLCGWTPLHLAAARNDVQLVKFLTRRPGIALDARDYAGRTPRRLARTDELRKLLTSDDFSSDEDETDDEELSSSSDLFDDVIMAKSTAVA